MKTLRNLALFAALGALGIGAALAHGHGQHGQQGGCQAGGERHPHQTQKDEKHEHERR